LISSYLFMIYERKEDACFTEIFHDIKGTKHRVGRVLSFFSSRRNWDSPNPSPEGECAPLPPVLGGGHTRQGERGYGRVPIPTRGQTLWYSLYIRTLWNRVTSLSPNGPRQKESHQQKPPLPYCILRPSRLYIGPVNREDI
jgi:hypothetical protein